MPNADEQQEPLLGDTESASSQSATVSYAFWLTLFVAAAIYASVALAPKLERLLVLQRDHAANQWYLVDLDQRVQNLEKVAGALKEDPQFAAELARSRFGAVEPGREAIKVAEDLQFGSAPAVAAKQVDLPWYYGIVSRFARSTTLRTTALCLSAVLTLLGFGFLHGRYSAMIHAVGSRAARAAAALTARYRTE